MVEDNQIQAVVSPFAIRPGEIKKFDGKDGYVSMNQIVHKINIGHINDLHFKILDIVNSFEFITSRQLFQLLEFYGFDPKTQDKLNNKLEQLIKSKVLTRYYFDSDEGKGTFRIYCLEKMGKYLLQSREQDCKWQQSDNTKPVTMIKKRLAGNQVIISYLRKTSVKTYIPKPTLYAKTIGKNFKVTGGYVEIEKRNVNVKFLFEVIRREENWEKNFADKMQYYKDFYTSFVPGDSNFDKVPQLVFICEDNKHMAEVFKEIYKNKIEIPYIKLYYSTELNHNSDSLENVLYTFELNKETNKFEMKNMNIKFLAKEEN